MVYSITLHEKDRDLLLKIKDFFGCGGIYRHGSDSLKYIVKSINDLKLIIDHFDKYPLKTKKLNDYKLFKLAFDHPNRCKLSL